MRYSNQIVTDQCGRCKELLLYLRDVLFWVRLYTPQIFGYVLQILHNPAVPCNGDVRHSTGIEEWRDTS